MKIAVLSDVHGNYQAFKSVIEVASRQKVERLIILGDIVGYYYQADKVLRALEKWDYELIKGNHEHIMSDLLTGVLEERAIVNKYGHGHIRALEVLSEKQIQMLLSAPDVRNVKYFDYNVVLCHGSPWSYNEYLYPDTSELMLNKIDNHGCDLVFCGHSHYQFEYRSKSSILVNVGSIGQNRQKGGVATWAIFDTVSGSVELQSTTYDIKPLLDEIDRYDPNNKYLKSVLKRGM